MGCFTMISKLVADTLFGFVDESGFMVVYTKESFLAVYGDKNCSYEIVPGTTIPHIVYIEERDFLFIK